MLDSGNAAAAWVPSRARSNSTCSAAVPSRQWSAAGHSMPIASEQIELPSFPPRTTMDHETRYDFPSQDIRERTVEEEDEQALSEGENKESTEMTSECTPRSSSSLPPSRAMFILAVIYTFPHSIVPLQSVFTHPFPRHHGVPSFWRHYNCADDRCIHYLLLVIS